MDLSDLRIFTAVVQEGGITRAAERLHRVQSNVTTRIRQLEENLGVDLFIREGKRLKLAPAGHTLLAYAGKLLDLAAEATEAVQSSQPNGCFRLGAMESTAAVRLPELLAQFNAQYPDVEIVLRTGNPTQLCQALLAGEIDAAFVAEPVPFERFECRRAFEEEAVIVTASNQPEITKKTGTPKAMIVFENGCPHRKRLETWYANRGEMPNQTIELASYHAMLGCVLAGMGAALLPKSVLATFPENSRLRIYDLAASERDIATLYVWRKGIRSPKIDAMAALINTERTGK